MLSLQLQRSCLKMQSPFASFIDYICYLSIYNCSRNWLNAFARQCLRNGNPSLQSVNYRVQGNCFIHEQSYPFLQRPSLIQPRSMPKNMIFWPFLKQTLRSYSDSLIFFNNNLGKRILLIVAKRLQSDIARYVITFFVVLMKFVNICLFLIALNYFTQPQCLILSFNLLDNEEKRDNMRLVFMEFPNCSVCQSQSYFWEALALLSETNLLTKISLASYSYLQSNSSRKARYSSLIKASSRHAKKYSYKMHSCFDSANSSALAYNYRQLACAFSKAIMNFLQTFILY